MINLFKQLLAAIRYGLAAGLICGMLPAVAFADSVQTVAEPRTDGVGYLLVLFCVALSIIILARSSNRSPEVRLKELEEE